MAERDRRGAQGGKDTLSCASLPKEACSALMQPRLPRLKGFMGGLGSRGTTDGGGGPSWAALGQWGKPRACPRAGSSPGRGTKVVGSWATHYFGEGCQRVLLPVQEPPARTCWPPVLVAPARMAASARSQRTTRASPAVAPLAGKVGAWPSWGFSRSAPVASLLSSAAWGVKDGGEGAGLGSSRQAAACVPCQAGAASRGAQPQGGS